MFFYDNYVKWELVSVLFTVEFRDGTTKEVSFLQFIPELNTDYYAAAARAGA